MEAAEKLDFVFLTPFMSKYNEKQWNDEYNVYTFPLFQHPVSFSTRPAGPMNSSMTRKQEYPLKVPLRIMPPCACPQRSTLTP